MFLANNSFKRMLLYVNDPLVCQVASGLVVGIVVLLASSNKLYEHQSIFSNSVVLSNYTLCQVDFRREYLKCVNVSTK